MRFEALLERRERDELSCFEAAEMLGGERADVSPLAQPAARRGACGLVRSSDRQAVQPSRGGRGDPAHARALARTLCRLHGQALPRAVGEASRLPARLYGDQAAPAPGRAGQAGAAARGAPQEAAAAADGRHAAAPGRLTARLARRRSAARPGGHVDDATSEIDRRFWSRRKAPPPASAACARWWRRKACSAPSTPTGRAITFTRPRPAVRCRGRSRRRSAGRSPGSASSTSPPTRRKRAAGPSGPSAPCRIACRRSSGSPASAASRRPIASSPRSTSPNTTPASPSPPSRMAPPSSSMVRKPGVTSSASARSGESATTIPSSGSGSACRSRRRRPHFVRSTVRVHEYPDGTLAVFLGPHRLADYDAEGRPLDANALAA